MSLKNLVTEGEKTHLDHREKDADGTENSFGWGGTRDFLCEIQPVDGHIQRGEDAILPLGLLGFVRHGRNARWSREGGAMWGL